MNETGSPQMRHTNLKTLLFQIDFKNKTKNLNRSTNCADIKQHKSKVFELADK